MSLVMGAIEPTPALRSVDEGEFAPLWAEWRANPRDSALEEAIVNTYMYLVDSEVSRIRRRIPGHVNPEELQAAGLEALFLALRNFNSEMGRPFQVYARMRIQGSMLDLLRCLDGVPRNARRANRQLSAATHEFRGREGRTPCQEELAAELKLSEEELLHLEGKAQKARRFSLDAGGENEEGGNCEHRFAAQDQGDGGIEQLIASESREEVVAALQALPERERAILVLHYYEGIRFNEIAQAMGVSEPRISQLHSQALGRLREFLGRRRVRVDA